MSKVAIQADCSKEIGKIKPMHAVNNGPTGTEGDATGNFDAYKAAKIPFARNHDAAFYASYGGEHIVDIQAVFPDFSKDENDENAYDFTLTDFYLQKIVKAGTEVFYRLGSKIEHSPKKYGTLMPTDFAKWARVAEHIIRHYNEGWANGLTLNIKYWEIWNEPDLHPDDTPLERKSTWSGTWQDYFDFYNVVAAHLKNQFPHLKIGGPALAYNGDFATQFIKQLKAPLDFFSWHIYTCNTADVRWKADYIRNLLDENGYAETESICNEWNYLKGWSDEQYIQGIKAIKSIKGASYTAAVMLDSQKGSVDMLMYYDARPTSWNGMFNTDLTCELLKGYYPFLMFSKLWELNTEIQTLSSDSDVYVCGAKQAERVALMIAHYNDAEGEEKQVEVSLQNLEMAGKTICVYMLDKDNDMQKVQSISGDTVGETLQVTMPAYSVCLIEVK